MTGGVPFVASVYVLLSPLWETVKTAFYQGFRFNSAPKLVDLNASF
jgi:hypothetical protein